ncbi:MAG: hypothetical protein OEY11_02620 [Gammaproteobacteria bacterium]|nr:hypothetical protein [Gammaproteobacteria bacterium]
MLCFFGLGLTTVAADEKPEHQQLKLGLELIEQKKYQQAEKYFVQLKQQHPQQIAYLNNLAVAQMAQGKMQQALENLKAALTADKYIAVSQNNMSSIYAYMASQAYSKALDKASTNTLPQLASITEIKPALTAQPATEKAKPLPALQTQDELKRLFEKKMNVWIKAWSKGDTQLYLANYSKNFMPAAKLSYKDWLALRRYRLRHSKQVEVSYNQFDMFLNAAKTTAIVEFVQHYRAGKYRDKVRKQLYWRLEGDRWLITREQVTEKLK